MGWKLAVVISKLERRTLGAFVDEVYGAPQTLMPSDVAVDRALYPPKLGHRYALAHDGFGWIVDWKLIDRTFKKPLPVKTPVWTFGLHSVVNWYGFSAQNNGAFLRSRSGEADNGIVVDIGTPSATERALVAACGKPGQEALAWDTWCDAQKSFDGVYEHTTHDSIGEEVVFGLLNEVVGFGLDIDSPALDAFLTAGVMTIERAKGKSIFSWLSR